MEWSFPWLSIDGDRMYDDSDFSKFFEGLFSYGVSLTTANALKVTASPNGGMKVQVDSGYAFVGKVFLNSTTKALSIDVASSMQDRTDSIVVRVDKSVRDVFLVVKKNDTTVTRTSDVYELQLATIKVPRNVSSITADLITDKRADEKVCGYSSPFQKVNVSGLEDQYKRMLDLIIQKMNEYTAEEKGKFEADMQAIINLGNAKLNDFTTLFYDWFNNLKDQLDGNQAAKLQNQIDEMKPDAELGIINHKLRGYPAVRALYWEYGAGLVGAATEPTGAGASTVKQIPSTVEHLNLFGSKVFVPKGYQMSNPELLIISDTEYRFVSGFKVIQIDLIGGT